MPQRMRRAATVAAVSATRARGLICAVLVAALLCGCLSLPVLAQGNEAAASPPPVAQDSLAWLVPGDAGLVVEASDLAPAAEHFLASPLGQRWRRFPPIQRWWEQNREQALRMVADLGRYLQVPPEDIWQHVLGHRVLLAAWPPTIGGEVANDLEGAANSQSAPGHRPPASTLLILRSQQAATIAQLVDGFCTAQERFEHVEWTEFEHSGVVVRQGQSARGQDLYVAVVDATAVVSDTRRVVEAVLDLHAGRTHRDRSLAATATYREATGALPADVAVRLFVPAPAWNHALAADAAQSTGRAQIEKQQFLSLWRGLESLSITLQLDEQIAVQALARFNPADWPRPVQTLYSAVRGPTPLADKMPGDCLAAAAGRIDLAMILDALESQQGEAERPEGWRLVRNALAVFTGDFGLYLVEGRGELPVDSVATASILPRWKDESAASTPGDFLQVATEELLRIAASRQPELSVERRTVADHTLLVVEHAPALGPARQIVLTVAGDQFWAATSPAAIEGALSSRIENPAAGSESPAAGSENPATGGKSLAAAVEFGRALPSELPAPSGFFFVNAARCRVLLDTRRDELVASIVAARQKDEQRVERGLQQLYAVLELCDRAVVATQFSERSSRLVITIAAD